MKKIIVLIVALVMVLSIGLYVFADEETYGCGLSEDDWEKMIEVKTEFLAEQVKAGDLTQEEADELMASFKNNETGVFRGFGFGYWMRDSEYADDMYDIMENNGSRGGCGGRGRYSEDN